MIQSSRTSLLLISEEGGLNNVNGVTRDKALLTLKRILVPNKSTDINS